MLEAMENRNLRKLERFGRVLCWRWAVVLGDCSLAKC